MATIFPGSASVNQIFDGYEFNGTAWDIIGIDLTADYPEIVGGKISASVIPDTFATVSYVDQEVGNINLSPYLTQSSASTTYLTQASASTTYATKTELNNIDLSSASAAAVAAIVDSAPSTLNTLNELAAALGDDANYASTITTALGNKLDTSTASSLYLTQASASTNYLTKTSASSTYLTQVNASTIYATKLEAQSAAKGFNLLNATTDVALGTIPGSFGSDVLVYVDVNDYAYSVGDNVKLKNIYDVGELNPVLSASATSASALNSASLEYQLVTFNTSSPMDIYPNQYITASAANGSGWVIQLFVDTVSGTVITGYPQTLTAPASATVTSSWIFERDTINSPLPTYYNASRNIIGNISSVGSNSYTVDIIQQPTAMWESNTCDVSLLD